jgi:ribulose-phosphate 3-epimerase
LMVLDVGSFVKELVALEYVSRIIFPVEMRGDVNEIFYLIQKHDKQVGLSLNPKTPVKKLENFIDDIDLVLFLAVEPGFSGQKLIESVFEKIDRVKKLNRNVAIEVDGGVNFENVSRLAKSGVDFLAVNSALYKADDFYLTYEKLDKLVNYPQ